jgi:hypothetical protein
MDLIATDEIRGKGFFWFIIFGVYSIVPTLSEIKNLIIPSNPHAIGMWNDKYRFNLVKVKLFEKDSRLS